MAASATQNPMAANTMYGADPPYTCDTVPAIIGPRTQPTPKMDSYAPMQSEPETFVLTRDSAISSVSGTTALNPNPITSNAAAYFGDGVLWYAAACSTD